MLFELLVAATTAVGVGLFILFTAPLHARWSTDHAGSGVQKHHHGSPSRVGLLPILMGCLAGVGWLAFSADGADDTIWRTLLLMLACAMPAALCGLLEDVTKKVRARWRLLGPVLGTLAAMWLLGAHIPALGVPLLDTLLDFWPVAIFATILMVVGFTQAMNIVDGLNGLSSGLALLMLLATAWAAHAANDLVILQMALLLASAILGFWVINFPRGLMFLGDGGAYFLGFMLALLWVMLLVRNPGEVSVWFIMAIAAHPTMETIYSILRRRFLRARPRPATAPDRLHLHTLIFRRRTRPLVSPAMRAARPWAANAMASAALLVTTSVPVLIACMNPASHVWGLAVIAISIASFLFQFRHMVSFRGGSARSGDFVLTQTPVVQRLVRDEIKR